MLDAHVNFQIENVNLEYQNVFLTNRIRLCVLHKSCSHWCYLVKGFDFTQKRFI